MKTKEIENHNDDCICNSCLHKKINDPKYKERKMFREHLKKWINDPSIIDKNIKLYNEAPKTVAERDRLKEINTELLVAIKEAVDLALNRKVINQSILESWQKIIAKTEPTISSEVIR